MKKYIPIILQFIFICMLLSGNKILISISAYSALVISWSKSPLSSILVLSLQTFLLFNLREMLKQLKYCEKYFEKKIKREDLDSFIRPTYWIGIVLDSVYFALLFSLKFYFISFLYFLTVVSSTLLAAKVRKFAIGELN